MPAEDRNLRGNGIRPAALFGESDVLGIGASGYLIARTDPTNTDTPVQDTLDKGGPGTTVILPATTINESGTVTLDTRQGIYGRGRESVLSVTPDAGALIEIPDSIYHTHGGGFIMEGQGVTTTTSDGLVISGSSAYHQWGYGTGPLEIRQIAGVAISANDQNPVWSTHFGRVRIANVDSGAAGNHNAAIEWYFGVDNAIQSLHVQPDNSSSGTSSKIFHVRGADMEFGHINAGGNCDPSGAVSTVEGSGSLVIGYLNFEPNPVTNTPGQLLVVSSNNSTTPHRVVTKNILVSEPVNDVYFTRDNAPVSGGSYSLATPHMNATLGRAKLYVRSAPNGKIIYEGPTSDVTLNNASTNQDIPCLGDLSFADA